MAARPDSKASEAKDKPPTRGKGIWIGAVVSILVVACVAAGWYFTRPAAGTDGDEAQAAHKPAETIFVTLEPFTVNLADEGGERLAQLVLVLELDDKDMQDTLNRHMPIVRNSILLLLSAQHSKTLLTLEGKLALADEVALRSGVAMGWKPADADEDEVEDEKPAQSRKVGNRKPKKRARRGAQPNPVVAVHFSKLLVQ